MSIAFMVLSAPRSASTWVANLLNTERTLCLHDPVLMHAPEELDALPCDRQLGFVCTATAMLGQWVNAHPARKVIVHRDLKAINDSLERIGLTRMDHRWPGWLDRIAGLHVQYEDWFIPSKAAPLVEFLTGHPFDAPRHAQLIDMHVEPNFDRIAIEPGRASGFRHRVEALLG